MEGGDAGAQNENKGNGEIDTSARLGLVREAVALFEERVHVGDLEHVNRVQQISKARGEVDDVTSYKLKTMTLQLELKETKQNVQRAIDEGMVMATCLSILQKELEQTKRELQQLKQKEQYFKYESIAGPAEEDWVEKDVKHVEDVIEFQAKPELNMNHVKGPEFHKNHVTFANEPSLTKFFTQDKEKEAADRRNFFSEKRYQGNLIAGVWHNSSRRISKSLAGIIILVTR